MKKTSYSNKYIISLFATLVAILIETNSVYGATIRNTCEDLNRNPYLCLQTPQNPCCVEKPAAPPLPAQTQEQICQWLRGNITLIEQEIADLLEFQADCFDLEDKAEIMQCFQEYQGDIDGARARLAETKRRIKAECSTRRNIQ